MKIETYSNEQVNNRYGTTYGDIKSAITTGGLSCVVSAATYWVKNPLGFIISFSVSVGFTLAGIKDAVDASVLKSEVSTVLKKMKSSTIENQKLTSTKYPNIVQKN